MTKLSSETKSVMAVEDLLALKYVSDPRLSPGGKKVIFVLNYTNPEEMKECGHLWLFDIESGQARQFTFGPGKDSSPRWSPDGKQIAFISTREDEKQRLFLIPSDGGEAKPISDEQITEISDVEWSPDGTALAFSAKTGKKDGEEDEEEEVYQEVTRLLWKMDGEGWWDGKWRHIWTLTLSGELNQLTDGEYDHQAPHWSPDGRQILFTADRTPTADQNRFSDLWLVPATGGTLKRLTEHQCGINAACWSPTGEEIAYIGQEVARGPNSNSEVRLLTLDNGEEHSLTNTFDHSVGDYVLTDAHGHIPTPLFWPKNGNDIYFLATDHGSTNLYRVPADGEEVSAVIQGKQHIFALHVNDAGQAVTGIDTPLSPGELFFWKGDKSIVQLTHCNDDFLATKELTSPEPFNVENEVAWEIQGWLLKPPGFDPQKQYPLIVEIHGGPHAAYGWGWFHEFQLLAGAGYAVLFTNPRGSQGYGEAFNDSIRFHWAPPVQKDIELALDEILSRGFVDKSRIGVTGGSYGGYMTNWIVGHSDRFAAAVSQRSCSNYINLYGNDDMGHYFGTGDAPGTPWENPQWYIDNSPLFYAPNIKTPLLLIHSKDDLRCTLEQAEQLYRALRVLDREVGLVIFKDSSHGLSRTGKPKQRLERLRRILGWFQKYMPETLSAEAVAS